MVGAFRMSVANDSWNTETDWTADWRSLPKGRKPSSLLLPSARFTIFALTAIVAGAALAFVT
jgi:hypothetical protein